MLILPLSLFSKESKLTIELHQHIRDLLVHVLRNLSPVSVAYDKDSKLGDWKITRYTNQNIVQIGNLNLDGRLDIHVFSIQNM